MGMWVRFLQSEFYRCFCPVYKEIPICTALVNEVCTVELYLSLDRNIRENNQKDPLVHEVCQKSNVHISVLCSNFNGFCLLLFPLNS